MRFIFWSSKNINTSIKDFTNFFPWLRALKSSAKPLVMRNKPLSSPKKIYTCTTSSSVHSCSQFLLSSTLTGIAQFFTLKSFLACLGVVLVDCKVDNNEKVAQQLPPFLPSYGHFTYKRTDHQKRPEKAKCNSQKFFILVMQETFIIMLSLFIVSA